MDSGFATKMIEALDTLKSGFDSFTGKTITEAVWNGDAADNAKNQVSEKIDPKVEAAKEKLNNLVEAIAEAGEAERAKENIKIAENAIANLNKDADDYHSALKARQAEKEKFEKEFEEHIAKVKSLCGS